MKKFKLYALIFIGITIMMSCGKQNSNNTLLTTDEFEIESSANNKTEKKLPVITFEEEIHDFGKIYSGEIVSYTYTFTNTGNDELIITQVKPDCGCTTPSFPRYAIAPGEQGKIKVKFDSKGRSGLQTKRIKIIANTNPQVKMIQFKAMVEK